MFNLLRASRVNGSAQRLFSTSASRQYDLAKLTLIGRLGRDPEVRKTSSDKEYMTYTVATTNYPPPPANPDGSRPSASTSWHNIFCFNPYQFNLLKTLPKGTQVYVECNFELREPDSTAEEGSPHSQRQIFLRQDTIRVLKRTGDRQSEVEESETSNETSGY